MLLSLSELAEKLDRSSVSVPQAGASDCNDLQDTIAGRNAYELNNWYVKLDQRQRKNFWFIAFRVLDHDTAISLLQFMVIEPKVETERAAMQADAAAKIRGFEYAAFEHKTDADLLREQVAELQQQLAAAKALAGSYKAMYDGIEAEVEPYKQDAMRFRTMRQWFTAE